MTSFIGFNDLMRRLISLEKAVAHLQRGATATTPQAPEATDEDLFAVWDTPRHHSFSAILRAIYNLGRQHGSTAIPAPVPISAPEPTPDSPPVHCVERRVKRGKSYDGFCLACGLGAPRWEACRRALAQELPAPAGGLLDQVTAAIAKAHDNRFPNEQHRSDAKWAVRAVAAWLDSNAGLPDVATPKEADGWEMAAQVLQREVNRG